MTHDFLTFHEQFSDEEFETQYNLREGRPDYEVTVIPDWIERSEAAKVALNCELDVRYGEGPKQLLDVYSCGNADAATLIYFHGGYWQRGDKSVYSFLAEPFVAAGVNVVVVGYDLCPDVTITRISEESREAIAYIWRNATDLGINRDRITVMGHSAGGHITEMMMGTDWVAYGDDLPADLVVAGVPISPLSLLEPVRRTLGLNSGIRMDAAEAEAESPMLNHPPVTNAPQLVVVGGAETDEFHRQSQIYVDAFGNADRPMEMYVVPGVDHFDELNVLANPDSPFFELVMALMANTGSSSVTMELVDAIGDAFNANDIDAVMGFFADDAIFDHAVGREVHGARFEGKDAIRDVFAGLFDNVKNVDWQTLDVAIVGDKAYCEYRRVAHPKEGDIQDFLSVDILTFRDGLIVHKDTYYKSRVVD